MLQAKFPAVARPARCSGRGNARFISPRCSAVTGAAVTTSPEVIDALNARKRDELVAKFMAMDSDGNGSIDREELRHLLESTDNMDAVMFTQHWLPDEELDRILEVYDKDKNGTIELNEFMDIVADGLLLDAKLSEYEEAFRAVDTSGNGTIGATELSALFTSLGNPQSYEKLVEIMQKYDRDESGQLEFDEVLLMFRDQLLDLKEVQKYMELKPRGGLTPSASVLDSPEGDMVLIFSNQELDELLASTAKSGKALVVFNALTWCRPCKAMQRPAQRMAAAYKDTTMWAKVFGNANAQTKQIFKDRFKVRSTPCFLVFKDGEVVYTQTGTNKEKLEAGLRAALGGDANPALPAEALYPSIAPQ